MDTLGRYKILKESGRGAMGVVYQGYDPEIGRTVAIKTLRRDEGAEDIAPEQASKQFVQEIKIVGQLQHPNVVTLYDVGESGGIKYFAMEYVEGRPLSSWIRSEGHPSTDQALEIVKAIAQGLAYAHGKGVIHRDIKPSNIMVSNDGEVKITDFGIARWSAISLDPTHSLTGTPKYISPEQVSGKGIDHRADIFSLGVLAYELFTGVTPFDGETLTRIIQMVLYETPPPPTSVNPELPESLNTALMRALEKSPDKRPRDMTAFQNELLAALTPAGTEDRTVRDDVRPPEAAPARGQKAFSSLYGTGLAATAVVAIILVFVVSRWSGQPSDSRDFGKAYAQAFEQVRDGDIEKATRSFEELLGQEELKDKGLVGLAYLKLRDGDPDGAAGLCSQALQLNPQNLYARVLRAQVLFQKKDLDPALRELADSLETAKGANWEKAEAYTLLGRIHDLQGMTEKSLSSYEEAILLDPTNPVPYTNKGTLLSRMGNYQGSVASYQDLLKVSDSPTARLLATESQRQLAFQADEKKHQRIRSLIENLNQGIKESRNKGAVSTTKDQWSSRSLTVSVCPFPEKGSLSLDASTGLYLQARVIQELGTEPGRSLVNREILDSILKELQLARSELADRDKALQVGRIAGAQLIVTGTLFHLGGRLQAVVQVVETETSYVKAALSEEQGPAEDIGAFSERIAGALSEAIDTAFPLRGKITRVAGNEVVLNVGREVGAKEGMQFKVLPYDQAQPKKKAYIGILTLTRIMEDSCLARVDEEYDDLQKGQRVVKSQLEDQDDGLKEGHGT